MKVVFIVRSTLFSAIGGDTFQVQQTAKHLELTGVAVDIKLTHETIDYHQYDLLHFFNITRPADILYHINRSNKPFLLSPILIDYSEYDKYRRSGIAGVLFRFLSPDSIEYLKTISRWLLGRDKLVSKVYLWKGHRKSILEILSKASIILPNTLREYEQLLSIYKISPEYCIVPNGVDPVLFPANRPVKKDPQLVVCAARIEGIKNQQNLIKALNNTDYKLMIIGSPAGNQSEYYKNCRKIAADNISFIDQLPQEELMHYYQKAKVHILPSWFETCGLSSLEAGVSGCNIVVTEKGFTREYYEDFAFYCDPGSPTSIFEAVKKAIDSDYPKQFREVLLDRYTWSHAAEQTRFAYEKALQKNKQLRIGILGTRGIPNHYGGFEQFAEHISAGLVNKGHTVFVYNSHDHPNREKKWNNTEIIHCYDPEKIMGTFGQFIYDFNCIRDARKRKLDTILMLGYTSSSVWGWLFPRKASVIFNMDGMEWKRSKYTKLVRKFLAVAEKLAVRFGDFHIADSQLIQTYLKEKYQISSKHISYGANIPENEDEALLKEYNVNRAGYFILMARMEPENNIEVILDGFAASNSTKKFLVIGNTNNKFGKYLIKKFKTDQRIIFPGSIYNNDRKLHTLKTFSALYFHGHSVGGTNPSLLEAMASKALIAAHDNAFNKAILKENAFYFRDVKDVKQLVDNAGSLNNSKEMIDKNLQKIKEQFSWAEITERYNRFILESRKVL